MTEHTIWVVCATRGKDSDRDFWVVCWAMSEVDAARLAETLTAEQEKFQTPWKCWLAENGKYKPLGAVGPTNAVQLLQQDYNDRKKQRF